MKRLPFYLCCGFRRAVGVALIPPVAWVGLVALFPTECARRTVADRLEHASGRKVTLGALRLGVFGGVELRDLAIGSPASPTDPFLKVENASIDVSLLQLLLGRVDPTNITIDGVNLRVLRLEDGHLELADLLTEPVTAPTASSNATAAPLQATFRIHRAKVRVIDRPTRTLLELHDVDGTANCKGLVVRVTELNGTLNGGPFRLAAQFDRSGQEPAFEGEFRASDVSTGDGMSILEYLLPVLSGTSPNVSGKIALRLYARGRAGDRAMLRDSLVGNGDVTLDPVEMAGSRLLASMCSKVENASETHLATVHSTMVLKQGKVITDNLTVDFGRVPVVLSGSTTFDGRIDYRLRAEGLAERLQSKAQDVLARLKVDVNDLNSLRIVGTLDDPQVIVDGKPVEGQSKLRDIGRRIRDKSFR